MPKLYSSPQLTAISQLSESDRRALLVPLLLSPHPTHPADRRMYHLAKDLLFTTECEAALRNLRYMRSGTARPQFYRTDLYSLIGEMLVACRRYLNTHRYHLSVSLHGTATEAAVCPRYLQAAILHLLRSAFKRTRTAYITVDLSAFSCRFQGSLEGADLTFPRAVAALHGGRLLQCGESVVLEFKPDTQKSACPRWYPPDADALLRDPLSVVKTALSNFHSSDGGS